MTGRGYMDVNRISGYIPGKMVFFLMQARTCRPLGLGSAWCAGKSDKKVTDRRSRHGACALLGLSAE